MGTPTSQATLALCTCCTQVWKGDAESNTRDQGHQRGKRNGNILDCASLDGALARAKWFFRDCSVRIPCHNDRVMSEYVLTRTKSGSTSRKKASSRL